MAMARGTALVSESEVVQLTGVQDLALLEGDSELDLADLLVSASDAIYDQLEANGVDPTALTNESVYKDAVAYHFLARLVMGGYVPLPDGFEAPESPYSWSDPFLKRRIPKTAGDDPRHGLEGLPAVGNFEAGWVFGGGTNPNDDQLKTWLPGSRSI